MPSIGVWEWVIIFLIILVIFGPKNLPRVGQALGKGIREFKDAARGLTRDLTDEEEERREIESRAIPRQELGSEKTAQESKTHQA